MLISAAAVKGAQLQAKKKQKEIKNALSRTEKLIVLSLSSKQYNDVSNQLKSFNNRFDFITNIDHGEKDEEVDDDVHLPATRPRFISQRHFIALGVYFSGEKNYDPSWLEVYYGYRPDELNNRDVDSQDGSNSNSLAHLYNEFVFVNQVVVASSYFGGFIVFCIILAGVLVGVKSYPSMRGNVSVKNLDLFVQVAFTADCAIRILNFGFKPIIYWTGSDRAWNTFDFLIVIICWIPIAGVNVAFLRLLRLMRLLKLVGKVKQLKVIVMGLMKGLSAVTYIVILLVLVFYLFAVLGVTFFRRNDPFHFGFVGIAMVTLYRIATFESWTSIMYINIYGCNSQTGSVLGWYSGKDGNLPFGDPPNGLGDSMAMLETEFGAFPQPECWSPQRQPLLAVVYFIGFAIIAALVIFSFFIGAICGGMGDALAEYDEKEEADKIIMTQKKVNEADPNGPLMLSLKDVFEMFDKDGSGMIDHREFAAALKHMGENLSDSEVKEKMKSVDKDDSGTINFDEFIFLITNGEVDFLKSTIDTNNEKVIAMMKKKADLLSKQNSEAQERLEISLRRAWGFDQEERAAQQEELLQKPLLARYLLVSERAEQLVMHPHFVRGMTLTICLAGVLVGVSTDLAVPSEVKNYPALDALDVFVLIIFTFEVTVKIVAEGRTPLKYFNDAWNRFDFFVVLMCDIFSMPGLPHVGPILAMVRLLRLLRVLKLVKAVPQLRVMIEALILGVSSITFVTAILFIFFYVYANIGFLLFSENDKAHFGNIQNALVSLVQVATFDSWSDLLYTNMYGCDNHLYNYGRSEYGFSEKEIHKRDHANCNHPKALGWLAAAYFISFCIMGGQVLLTLFIGIVATAMDDAKDNEKDENERAKRCEEHVKFLGLDERQMDLLREVFEILDVGCTNTVSREDVKRIVKCLPAVTRGYKEDNGRGMIRLDVEKIFEILSTADQRFSKKQPIEFPEFLVVADMIRKLALEERVIESLRTMYDEVADQSHSESEARPASAASFPPALGTYQQSFQESFHESSRRLSNVCRSLPLRKVDSNESEKALQPLGMTQTRWRSRSVVAPLPPDRRPSTDMVSSDMAKRFSIGDINKSTDVLTRRSTIGGLSSVSEVHDNISEVFSGALVARTRSLSGSKSRAELAQANALAATKKAALKTKLAILESRRAGVLEAVAKLESESQTTPCSQERLDC